MKHELTQVASLFICLCLSTIISAQDKANECPAILDSIFGRPCIKIGIPHHGGFTASNLGKAIMEIEHLKSDSSFHVHYKDAIDRRQLDFIIDEKEYQKLKSIFIKLLAIHQANKSLSGDCYIIDKNYILKTKNEVLIIKPDKNSQDFDCLDEWIYAIELKN
ncbi:hypothetical protein [Carboxylicivirga sp. N1Y90]|uniref:hypothetical protein n=1 Tax=Carboxylicivirga fragile TaxID=3417571 RepID=UPI003D32C0EE|nr:hypothetical protein [Marinilabiliaceae bacterium N1Y90]